MADIASLVVKADTSQVKKATSDLKGLEQQGKRTDTAVDNLTESTQQLNQSSKNLKVGLGGAGRGAGQAGIQVQQFVGQVQAGQDPMVAFSQQAADLGIVLGVPLLGAVLGIAGALGTVLLPALFKSKQGFEDLLETADELDISLASEAPALFAQQQKILEKEVKAAQKALDEGTKTLEKNTEKTTELSEKTEQRGRNAKATALAVDRLSASEEGLAVNIDELSLAVDKAQFALDKFNGQKTKAEQAAEDFGKAILEETQAFGKSEAALLREEAAQHELTSEQELAVKIMAELLENKQKLIDARKEDAARAKEEAQATREAAQAKREADAADRALAKEQAVNQARIKAEELGREKEAAESRQQIRAAEDEARRLGLIDVEQSEIESFARRLEEQKKFAQNRNLSEQQRAEAQKNIEKQTNDFAIKSAGDALNSLGQVNAQAFKIAKAYNIGQAVMNTYTGATKALAELPPPLNFIVAAATVANGLAQVQQIRSQNFQGRALGGQVRGGESYVVGERGPEILSMGAGQSGNIIPNNRIQAPNQVTNRVANINFNISTVDARGFDSLLQSRRGQIVTIVNQAMNDRGTRGVA
tara:strand:+ start:615 stop:2384 length:1770 start_codon:yes stop_codon:yes gene_type:complete